MARRMYTAEDQINAIKAAEKCGPESKKRRSVGDSPPMSTCSSPSSQSELSTDTHNGMFSSAPSVSPFFTLRNAAETVPIIPRDVDMITEEDGINHHHLNGDGETGSTTTAEDGSSILNPNGNGNAHGSVIGAGRTTSPLTISLDGVVNPMDLNSKFYPRTNGKSASSAPPSSHADHIACPSCGRTITDSAMMAKVATFTGEPISSPLVVPPGPLAAAAFESGMSAVEELKLLKSQVQDVARVCNAVARGDLSQKITVPVQGVVMSQLKEVINVMVCAWFHEFLLPSIKVMCGGCFSSLYGYRSTNWVNSQRKSLESLKKSALKGMYY